MEDYVTTGENERRVRRRCFAAVRRKNSAIKNVSGATTGERNSTVGGGEL